MAQADRSSTAIRELVSRGRLAQSTSSVRLAHAEFVAALAGNVPHPMPTAIRRISTAAPTIWKRCSRRFTSI
jgi:hypothetical protein